MRLPLGVQPRAARPGTPEVQRRRLHLGQLGEGREVVHQPAQAGDLLAAGSPPRCPAAGGSPGRRPRYLMASSCTASWMGVSGFLISWARRRATSCQADTFCRYSRRRAGVAQLADHAVEGPGQSSSSSRPVGRSRTARSPAPTALGGVAQPGHPLGGPAGEKQAGHGRPPPAGPPRTPGTRGCTAATVALEGLLALVLEVQRPGQLDEPRRTSPAGCRRSAPASARARRSPGHRAPAPACPRACAPAPRAGASQISPTTVSPSSSRARSRLVGARPDRPCAWAAVAASARVRRRNSSLRSMK